METAVTDSLLRKNTSNTVGLRSALSKLPDVLKTLKFDALRPGQDGAIFNLFAGLDTLLLLPTGSGKSAVYIIPTLCMGYRTLIFSPLIALMKDQVEKLWGMGLKAAVINSAQSGAENAMSYSEWQSGALSFLFVAPERLADPRFRELMRQSPPDLVTCDEAHVASAWSDSFRPEYKTIGEFILEVKPKTVLALTATATPEVDEDIRRILCMQDAKKVVYLPRRANLHLSSEDFTSDRQIFRALNSIKGQAICYCATVKRVNELQLSMGHMLDGGALSYTGKMTPASRDAAQSEFMSGKIRVMFATNAFGLGIDKPDIRGIIHAEVPGSLDSLVQEQGRASRDGEDAWCTAFFSNATYGTQMYFIDIKYPERPIVERTYSFLKKNAGPDGIIKMTVEQIGNAIGGRSDGVSSALSILANFKVLDRASDSDSKSTVKFLVPHLQEEYAKYVPAIEKIGFKNKSGGFEFDQTMLCEELALKPVKITETLKLLADNKYIQYTRPFRGKTTKLIGNLDLVDFEYIAKRRDVSIDKLNAVFKYHHIPDGKKHDFVESYFRGEVLDHGN